MEIHFDWRVALHRDDREALRKTIVKILKYWAEVGQEPAKVVVSPLMFDPYDERVVIEIQSDSGEVLGGCRPIELREVKIAEDGAASSRHGATEPILDFFRRPAEPVAIFGHQQTGA